MIRRQREITPTVSLDDMKKFDIGTSIQLLHPEVTPHLVA